VRKSQLTTEFAQNRTEQKTLNHKNRIKNRIESQFRESESRGKISDKSHQAHSNKKKKRHLVGHKDLCSTTSRKVVLSYPSMVSNSLSRVLVSLRNTKTPSWVQILTSGTTCTVSVVFDQVCRKVDPQEQD